jgi:putative transposase
MVVLPVELHQACRYTPLQHALKDLERAYRNFFAQRARFPRFKRKGGCESFRYPDSSGGKWYASIQTLREVDPPVCTATTAIGIDLGIARFATLSDGSYIAPLNSFRKHAARLRRYQRAMSRKVKFSKNWQKANRRVQTIHARIGNARRDFLHKATPKRPATTFEPSRV